QTTPQGSPPPCLCPHRPTAHPPPLQISSSPSQAGQAFLPVSCLLSPMLLCRLPTTHLRLIAHFTCTAFGKHQETAGSYRKLALPSTQASVRRLLGLSFIASRSKRVYPVLSQRSYISMRTVSLSFLLVSLAVARAALSQDPVSVDPGAVKAAFENDQIRVLH